ncbi:condensin complex subunit 3 [[Candida] railenensis]|uniref:Condensin complex subunit 3 n=1 Tax=[Candida] railenensis TaxID=45579 RepID=A0A9P0QNS4_9ASCO|nr:condensin complex subunit 3 [[Candida] railenensis]
MSYRPNAKSIQKINDLEGIYDGMAHVFQDAQLTLSGHRKLVIIMKNIHKRAIELGFEESFAMKFAKFINFILPLKKGEQVGDRIIKFCSVFIASSYKDEEVAKKDTEQDNVDEDVDEDEDTPTGKFVDYILRHLLRGIQAKDKHVRYRVIQLLAYLVNNIGEIDEELFTALQWSLNRRLYDKEPNVRLQAIVAISRFQYLPEGGQKASESILLAMQNDDSAEVRRAALLNLTKNETTIPFLLERARDTNSINRRLVFSRISKELGDFRDLDLELREELLKSGLKDREQSVQSAAVKMFATTWFDVVQEDLLELIDSLNVVNTEGDISDVAIQIFYQTRQDFVNTKVNITKEMWKELSVEMAFFIRSFYDYCNENRLFELIDKFYPESIELSEILSKYLNLRNSFIKNSTGIIQEYEVLHAKLESLRHEEFELEQQLEGETESQPREKEIEKLLVSKRDEITKELLNFEEPRQEYVTYYEQLKDLEFIIKQLIMISKDYDFSDEIGRREMLRIIRSSLTNDELSDELIELSLKVLKKISINERDFSTMCTEIVTDIRDSYMDEVDDTFHSAISSLSDEEKDDDDEDDDDEEDEEDEEEGLDVEGRDESKADTHKAKKRKKEPKEPPSETLIQCLLITKHLLELTEESISNVSLSSLLDSLVRPSVLRNDNLYIRNLAMTCLGLYCLLDKQLAIQQLYLFGVAASRADEELRILSIKVIVDILSTHGISVLDVEGQVDSLSLAKLFYKVLRLYEMPKLQCVVAEGLCKLFLADILTDFGKTKKDSDDGEGNKADAEQEDQEKVLFETLILTYFHPLNANNHELRQILAFCIPVYSFSHTKHQDKVASISGDCFYRLFRENGEFEKYENMATPSTILQQLIHWCDPNNLVNLTQVEIKRSAAHFWQAMGLLQALEQDTPRNIKKTIISNLNKLFITEELGSVVLTGLKRAIEDTRLVFETSSHDPSFALDSLSDRSFEKFYQNIKEITERAMEMEKVKAEEDKENSILSNISTVPEEKQGSPEEESVDVKQGENEVEDKEVEKETAVKEKSADSETEDIEDSLQKIDELLDEEDNVDYDVSMEDV